MISALRVSLTHRNERERRVCIDFFVDNLTIKKKNVRPSVCLFVSLIYQQTDEKEKEKESAPVDRCKVKRF
jgi:hypothetical protein